MLKKQERGKLGKAERREIESSERYAPEYLARGPGESDIAGDCRLMPGRAAIVDPLTLQAR